MKLSDSPQEQADAPKKIGRFEAIRKRAGQVAIAAALLLTAGQVASEKSKAGKVPQRPAGAVQKEEENDEHTVSAEHAKRTVEERIQLETYEKVMKLFGVGCGDGRNEKGITAFGGELMGIAYPVLKQVEIKEGRELREDEIVRFMKDYPNILVMHTDAHGLEHVVDEIKEDPLLHTLFTEAQLKEIVDNGLRTKHVQELLMREDGAKIKSALVSVAVHMQCQGCAHARRVIKDEHQDEGPDDHNPHLADKMLEMHIGWYLDGSDHNRVDRYPNEHDEDAFLFLTTEELDSDDDKVAMLTPAGKDRKYFWKYPQVERYGRQKAANYAAKTFPNMKFAQEDRAAFVQSANDFYEQEALLTVSDVAAGLKVYKATIDAEGKVNVKDGGKMPGERKPKK